MHPGFMPWWKHARMAREAQEADCGPWEHAGFQAHGFGHGHGEEGGSFGVRRPLRFLAYKLDLSEPQVSELAKVLDELKTERAQAAVDERRSISAFAEAVAGAGFDTGKAEEAAKGRVATAERLSKAVSQALGKIHSLLEPEQREKLAYLVRTGTLAL